MPNLYLTYVYFRIFKSLLQIVIDRLIGDLAEKCEIRYPNLLLLSTLEYSLLNLRFSPSSTRR